MKKTWIKATRKDDSKHNSLCWCFFYCFFCSLCHAVKYFVNWDFIQTFVVLCDVVMMRWQRGLKTAYRNFPASYFFFQLYFFSKNFQNYIIKEKCWETGNGSRDGLTLKLTLMRYTMTKFFFLLFILAKINETKILFVFQEITLRDEMSFVHDK